MDTACIHKIILARDIFTKPAHKANNDPDWKLTKASMIEILLN